MDNFLPVIRVFIESFLIGETLKAYRQFVNVYNPHPEDIKAINERNYEIENLQYAPSVYGGRKVFDFKVGKTSFRIWGEAAEYIKKQADSQEDDNLPEPAAQ